MTSSSAGSSRHDHKHPAVSPAIIGLGVATPSHGVHYTTASEIAHKLSCDDPSQHRAVTALYRRTKIANRGSVLLDEALGDGKINEFYPSAIGVDDRGPGTKQRSDRYAAEAPVLAHAAATAALQDANHRPADVTHLVTVSCTGFAAPGVDIALIKSLSLPATTQRISVGFMGCHGAINGLRAAQAIVAADPTASVLLVSVELCSLHYQYGFDPDRIVSGALFADGAAAIVIAAVDQNSQQPILVATGSLLIDDSQDAMTWRIGDHGYEMTLSSQVPQMIDAALKDYVVQFLDKYGETIESIGGWAVHPGGPRILDAVQSGLSLDPDALHDSRSILSEHGNMSSATMLFIIRRFIDNKQNGPWLMLGFGPGLEIEVALLRVDGTKS